MLLDFFALIFPKICASCGKSLYKNENSICTYCLYHLPKTNYHLNAENPVEKMFLGRVNIYSASSFYLFNKGGKVQQLIHQLKYKGNKDVGITLGKLYAHELKQNSRFNSINTIIPVPLHIKKERKRGYNQSKLFAEGLSTIMNVDCNYHSLIRTKASTTQTRKSRFLRWKNVESIFEIKNPEALKNQHILLVDDVITTGATLEACAQELLKIPGVKVSVATIAYAAN